MPKIEDDFTKRLALRQQEVVEYYDWFSKSYDLFPGDWYYGRARRFAVEQLQLVKGQSVLNLPCGTGLNYRHFQNYLSQTGLIIGVDLSSGMLQKAIQKTESNYWKNVINLMGDATQITSDWIAEHVDQRADVDAVLCDLGLSGFPDWEAIIDNLLSISRPNGRIVIMDWYNPRPTIRGSSTIGLEKAKLTGLCINTLKQESPTFLFQENSSVVDSLLRPEIELNDMSCNRCFFQHFISPARIVSVCRAIDLYIEFIKIVPKRSYRASRLTSQNVLFET